MKGIAGKQTRGLPTAARLHVADNTGAKVVQILNVLKLGGTMRRYPSAGVGDMAKVSVLTVRGSNSKTTLASSSTKRATSPAPTSKGPSHERRQNAGHVSQPMQSKSFEGISWSKV